MSARGPRIGRPDRIAALAQRQAEAAHRIPGMPAVSRLVMPVPSPPRDAARDVRESAARVVEELRPVPAALAELAWRINRHCAATDRDADAELARAVEAVRERTFALWLVTAALANAGKGKP